MASNRMNVGDLISDEPLDLSMKKTFHEKENFVRGPLVIQPDMPQRTNVVVARLWQTNVVIRSQESTQQQVVKVNEQPIHHKPQTSQQQQVEKVKEEQPAPLKVRTSTLPQQRTTRFRFTRKQINFMEQIFQIKQLLTNSEFLDTARVLNVNELSVSDSIYLIFSEIFGNVK
jgi:hypothetical protein